MAEQMASMFKDYMKQDKYRNNQEFITLMDTIEKDFTRTNEFICLSLTIMGKKAHLRWRKFFILLFLNLEAHFIFIL